MCILLFPAKKLSNSRYFYKSFVTVILLVFLFFKVTTVTDSLNNLTVQSGDDEVPGLTQHRVTKAQRRREKKTTQLKERELRIAEQEVQNLQGIRHIESLKINEILKKRDLMVFEIPSDGNW